MGYIKYHLPFYNIREEENWDFRKVLKKVNFLFDHYVIMEITDSDAIVDYHFKEEATKSDIILSVAYSTKGVVPIPRGTPIRGKLIGVSSDMKSMTFQKPLGMFSRALVDS